MVYSKRPYLASCEWAGRLICEVLLRFRHCKPRRRQYPEISWYNSPDSSVLLSIWRMEDRVSSMWLQQWCTTVGAVSREKKSQSL